jgi:hypothetical protein
MGNLCSLNELGPYLWVVWLARLLGKLMIWIASNGHFFTQMPQPMHSSSEIQDILDVGVTSTQSLPTFTTGQNLLHSCLHFLGLHRSELTTAIRVGVSFTGSFLSFFLPGAIGADAPVSYADCKVANTQGVQNATGRSSVYG